MRYSVCLPLLLTYSVLFFASCNEVENYDHFIDGYVLSQTDPGSGSPLDSSLIVDLKAYKFERPELIRASINEIELDNFSHENGYARSDDYIFLPKESSFKVLLEYDGLKNTFSSKLLPPLSSNNLEIIQLDGRTTLFKWPKFEEADYYSIEIVEEIGGTTANRVAWDTVIVDQSEIEIEEIPSIVGPNGSPMIIVSAVKGPIPEEEYYNLKGEIPGRLLIISQIMQRLNSQKRSNVELRAHSRLAADHILSRYKIQ